MNTGATNDDGKGHWMLQGIVALLLSLADIAERAAGAPRAIRVNVLWLLRPAEAVARKLALEVAWSPDLADLPPDAALVDDGPAEALRIARCFRAIAFMLSMLLAEYEGLAESMPFGVEPLRQHDSLAHAYIAIGRPRLPIWPDTS